MSRPPAIFPPPDLVGGHLIVFNKTLSSLDFLDSDMSLDESLSISGLNNTYPVDFLDSDQSLDELSISGPNNTYPVDFLDSGVSLDELTRPVPSLSISGLMWALAVPVLSGLINILTRQVVQIC